MQDLNELTDTELAYEIAVIEKLKIVYTSDDSLSVEPYEGGVQEYDPIKDNGLAHYLQCKYKVSIDFRMCRCYIESPYGSYLAGATYFKENESPNRAICEAIYDAKEEL